MIHLVPRPVRTWLIVGTDAHAKNHALLIGAGGRVRLAPLYDLASAPPYAPIDIKRAKLSMKIGGEYPFQNVQIRHWHKMAQEHRLDPEQVVERLRLFAAELPELASDVEKRVKREGLNHPLIPRIAGKLNMRTTTFQKSIR
jgi:serine/threonine-protein kinase HipA